MDMDGTVSQKVGFCSFFDKALELFLSANSIAKKSKRQLAMQMCAYLQVYK